MTNPPIVTSAYRSNFYIPENIIGFTGALHNNPTVYFMTDTEFGHITQYHGSHWNIGREPVGERFPDAEWEYKISNEVKNGLEVSVEKYVSNQGKGIIHIHTSRSRFFDTRRSGTKTFAILSQAIWNHRSKKEGEPGMYRSRI